MFLQKKNIACDRLINIICKGKGVPAVWMLWVLCLLCKWPERSQKALRAPPPPLFGWMGLCPNLLCFHSGPASKRGVCQGPPWDYLSMGFWIVCKISFGKFASVEGWMCRMKDSQGQAHYTESPSLRFYLRLLLESTSMLPERDEGPLVRDSITCMQIS